VYVLELAVRPECQRRGVGQRMVAALLANMAAGGPGWELRAVVSEDNLDGQLFARRCGFWGRLTADGIEFTRPV
jgi:ribosomal protein S18 acetylase RimI-like enzyme